jgi:GDPmannose 4,6-dehydratase
VREFVDAAAAELGIRLQWNGTGLDETATVVDVGQQRNIRPGQVVVRVDPRYFRPTEVDSMLGDATLAREKLGWSPSTSFKQLVGEMVRADLESAGKEQLLQQHDTSSWLYSE